jgi:hypothetical protein
LDADVQFYTGLSNANVYKTLFDHLSPKASVMHYWKEPRQTLKEAPMRYSMDDDPNLFFKPVIVVFSHHFLSQKNVGTEHRKVRSPSSKCLEHILI